MESSTAVWTVVHSLWMDAASLRCLNGVVLTFRASPVQSCRSLPLPPALLESVLNTIPEIPARFYLTAAHLLSRFWNR
jgi:hypothetical protein